MDMKRRLKSALKQLGFDKPRKAQIIPMNTLDAEQDAIVIAATGSGKQAAELAGHAVVVLPRGIQASTSPPHALKPQSMPQRSPLLLQQRSGSWARALSYCPSEHRTVMCSL